MLAFRHLGSVPIPADCEHLEGTNCVLPLLYPWHPAQHLVQRRRPMHMRGLNALSGGGHPLEPLI